MAKEKKVLSEGFVRIFDTDIPSKMSVYAGLTRVKGISFTLANAICNYLGINKNKKLFELTEEEINKINSFPFENLPPWLLNRRAEPETGLNLHLLTTKLDLAKEFDIRKMKKIKCYKGIRHSLGLPVRGQRTKSHFRKGAAVGVQKSKAKKR